MASKIIFKKRLLRDVTGAFRITSDHPFLYGTCTIFLIFSIISGVSATEDVHIPGFNSSNKEKQWSINPEIKLGVRSYEYESNGEKVFDVTFPSLKIGTFGEYGGLFGQGYYETSLGDADASVASTWDGSLGARGQGNLGPAVDSFNRKDWAILGGFITLRKRWPRFEGLGISGGYKSGKSEVDFKAFSTVPLGLTKYDYDVETRGPFLGIGAAYRVGRYGLLGFRAGYAWLDVDLVRKTNFGGKTTLPGEGNGVSLGIAWIGELRGKLQYTIEMDLHDYNFDSLDLRERQVTGRIGVTYLFK